MAIFVLVMKRTFFLSLYFWDFGRCRELRVYYCMQEKEQEGLGQRIQEEAH